MDDETAKIQKKLKDLQQYTLFINLVLERSKNVTPPEVFSKLQKMHDIIVGKKPCPSLEFLCKAEKSILNWKNRRKLPRAPSPDVISCLEKIEREFYTLKSSLERNSLPSTSKSSLKALKSQQKPKEIVDTIILTSSDEDDDVEIISVTAPPPADSINKKICDVPAKNRTFENVAKKEEIEIEEGEILDDDFDSDLIEVKTLELSDSEPELLKSRAPTAETATKEINKENLEISDNLDMKVSKESKEREECKETNRNVNQSILSIYSNKSDYLTTKEDYISQNKENLKDVLNITVETSDAKCVQNCDNIEVVASCTEREIEEVKQNNSITSLSIKEVDLASETKNFSKVENIEKNIIKKEKDIAESQSSKETLHPDNVSKDKSNEIITDDNLFGKSLNVNQEMCLEQSVERKQEINVTKKEKRMDSELDATDPYRTETNCNKTEITNEILGRGTAEETNISFPIPQIEIKEESDGSSRPAENHTQEVLESCENSSKLIEDQTTSTSIEENKMLTEEITQDESINGTIGNEEDIQNKGHVNLIKTAERECTEINWESDFFADSSSDIVSKPEISVSATLQNRTEIKENNVRREPIQRDNNDLDAESESNISTTQDNISKEIKEKIADVRPIPRDNKDLQEESQTEDNKEVEESIVNVNPIQRDSSDLHEEQRSNIPTPFQDEVNKEIEESFVNLTPIQMDCNNLYEELENSIPKAFQDEIEKEVVENIVRETPIQKVSNEIHEAPDANNLTPLQNEVNSIQEDDNGLHEESESNIPTDEVNKKVEENSIQRDTPPQDEVNKQVEDNIVDGTPIHRDNNESESNIPTSFQDEVNKEVEGNLFQMDNNDLHEELDTNIPTPLLDEVNKETEENVVLVSSLQKDSSDLHEEPERNIPTPLQDEFNEGIDENIVSSVPIEKNNSGDQTTQNDRSGLCEEGEKNISILLRTEINKENEENIIHAKPIQNESDNLYEEPEINIPTLLQNEIHKKDENINAISVEKDGSHLSEEAQNDIDDENAFEELEINVPTPLQDEIEEIYENIVGIPSTEKDTTDINKEAGVNTLKTTEKSAYGEHTSAPDISNLTHTSDDNNGNKNAGANLSGTVFEAVAEGKGCSENNSTKLNTFNSKDESKSNATESALILESKGDLSSADTTLQKVSSNDQILTGSTIPTCGEISAGNLSNESEKGFISPDGNKKGDSDSVAVEKGIDSTENPIKDVNENVQVIPLLEDKYMALIESIDQNVSDENGSCDEHSEDDESMLYNSAVSKDCLEKSKIPEKQNIKSTENYLGNNESYNKESRLSEAAASKEPTNFALKLNEKAKQISNERKTLPLYEKNKAISLSGESSKVQKVTAYSKQSSVSVSNDKVSKIGTKNTVSSAKIDPKHINISSKLSKDRHEEIERELISYDSLDSSDMYKFNKIISGAESLSSDSPVISSEDEMELCEKIELTSKRKKHKKHKKRHHRHRPKRQLRRSSPSNESIDDLQNCLQYRHSKRHSPSPSEDYRKHSHSPVERYFNYKFRNESPSPKRHSPDRSLEIYKSSNSYKCKHRSPIMQRDISDHRNRSCSPEGFSLRRSSDKYRRRSKSPQRDHNSSERSPKAKSDKHRGSKDRSISPLYTHSSRKVYRPNIRISSSSESEPTSLSVNLKKSPINKSKQSTAQPKPEPLVIVIDDDEEDEQIIVTANQKEGSEELTIESQKVDDSKKNVESEYHSENSTDLRQITIYDGNEVIATRRPKLVTCEPTKEVELSSSRADELVESTNTPANNETVESEKYETVCSNEVSSNEVRNSSDILKAASAALQVREEVKLDEPKLLTDTEKTQNCSEKNKAESKEDANMNELGLDAQCSNSRSSSPIITDNNSAKKSDKMDEWANKDLGELQKIRIKLENDLGVTLEDLKNYFQGQEPQDTPMEVCDSGPDEDTYEIPPAPPVNISAFQISAPVQQPVNALPQPMNAIPQSVSSLPQSVSVPPQPIPEMQPHYPSPFAFQGSFDILQFLGLPPGIKINDPRFKNRLMLLYNRTTNPAINVDRIPPNEHQIPQPADFFGRNVQSVQEDIRSACLQEIGAVTSSFGPNTSHQKKPSKPPTITKSGMTYGEYKKRRKQAIEAANARRRATLEAANKALETEIAKPRDPHSVQKLQVSSGETIIDKMYKSKKYDADVKTPANFRIPKKKEDKLDTAKDIEAILSAIDGNNSQSDMAKNGIKKNVLDGTVKKRKRKRKRKRPLIDGKDKEMTLNNDNQDSIIGKNNQKVKKARKLSSSSSENEDAFKRSRKLSSSKEVENETSKNKTRKLSESNTNELQRILTAPEDDEIRIDSSDSDDIYQTEHIAKLSSDLFCQSEEKRTSQPQTKTSDNVPESKNSVNSENGLKFIKNLIESIFAPKSQSHAIDYLSLLEPYVTPDKMREIKNVLNGDSLKAIPSPSKNVSVSTLDEKRPISPKKDEESKAQTVQRSKKGGNRELDNLHRDLHDMFIRDGVLTMTGRRICSIASEKRTSFQMGNMRSINKSPSPDPSEYETKLKKTKSITEDVPKPYHADEDADTDDFEEYIKSKAPESPKPILDDKFKNLPTLKVKLKRLTANDVIKNSGRKTNKKAGEDAALLKPLKVVPFSEQEKRGRRGRQTKPKKMEVKNINPEHHIRSSKHNEFCLLCPEKSTNMVSHYVSAHWDREVFISRLHSNDIEYITKNRIFATKLPGTQKKFSAICLFCDKEIKDRFHNFYEHYSSHTGEYAYECDNCDVRKCTKQAIVRHCKEHCNDCKFVRNYSYEKNVTKIKAYICTKCNYIQLHEANIHRHLRIEHSSPVVYQSDTQEIVLVEKIEDSINSCEIQIANEPVSSRQEDAEILFEFDTNKAVNNNAHLEMMGSPCVTSDNIADESIAMKAEVDPFDDLDRTLGGVTKDTNKLTSEISAQFVDKAASIMTMIHFTKDGPLPFTNSMSFLQDSEILGDQKPDVQNLQIIQESCTTIQDKMNQAQTEQLKNSETLQQDLVDIKPNISELPASIDGTNEKVLEETTATVDIKHVKEELDTSNKKDNVNLSLLDQLLNCCKNFSEEKNSGLVEQDENTSLKADIIGFPTSTDNISSTAVVCEPGILKESSKNNDQSVKSPADSGDDDVICLTDSGDSFGNQTEALTNVGSEKHLENSIKQDKATTENPTVDGKQAITIMKKEIRENFEQTECVVTMLDVEEGKQEDDDDDYDDSFPRLEIDLSDEQCNNHPTELPEKVLLKNDPTISCITNIGFKKLELNQFRYYCLIGSCSYHSSLDPEDLRRHVKLTHKKQWSGKCKTCRQRVMETGKLTLSQEIDHMLKVHINPEEEEEGESPSKRIKLVEIDECDITCGSSYLTSANKQLIERNELVPPIRILKPWVTKTISMKLETLCKIMKDEMILYSLYKCMGNDCSFATSSRAGMSYHIRQHEIPYIGPSDKRSWLECSYCEYIADCGDGILNHVTERHSSSIFQCSKCFYRSSTAYNVLIHRNLYHLFESDNLILTCHGKLKSVTAEMPGILEKRVLNVKPLVCEVCKATFYVREYLQNHMVTIHQKKINMKKASVGVYACVFCSSETDDLEIMREHMANTHPSELLYVCGRVVHPENAIQASGSDISTVNSTCLIYIGDKVDKNMFKSCPIKEALLHKTERTFGGEQFLIEPNVIDLTESEERTSQTSFRRPSSTDVAQKYQVKVMSFGELERLLQPSGPPLNVETKKSKHLETMGKELLRLINIATRNTGMIGRRLYVCCIPTCKESFINMLKWQTHLRFKHPEIPVGTKFKCPHCEKYHVISDFAKHFAQHKTHRYFCYFCGDTFSQVLSAERHLAAKHSYIKSRVMFLLPNDNEIELYSNSEQYFAVTSSTLQSDPSSLMEHMIDILSTRYPKKYNKDPFPTSKGDGASTEQQSTDKKATSNRSSTDELAIDLNSALSERLEPKFISPERRYICGYKYCKFRSADERSYELHFKDLHKTLSKFTCAHCSTDIFNVTNFARIRDHFKLHSEVVYLCCVCKTYLPTRLEVTRHINNNHKRVDVPIVSYIRTESDTKTQVEIIHPRKVKTIKLSKCFFCTQRYSEADLPSHLRNQHEMRVRYQCDYCPYSDSKEEIEKHVTNIHGNKTFRFKSIFQSTRDTDPLDSCTASPQSSTTSQSGEVAAAAASISELDESNKVAGIKRPYLLESTVCSSSVSNDAKRIKLNENSFACDKCYFTTNSKDSLDEHKSMNHERILQPSSVLTTKSGSTKTAVIVQKPSHKCNYCLFICENESDLEAHTKINHVKHEPEPAANAANITINFANSPSKPEPVINFTVSYDKVLQSANSLGPSVNPVDSQSVQSTSVSTKEPPKKSTIRLVPIENLLREDIVKAVQTSRKSSPVVQQHLPTSDEEFIDINEPITSDYLQSLFVDDQPEYLGTLSTDQHQAEDLQVSASNYKSSLNEIIFVCYHCKARFDNITELLKHWSTFHCRPGNQLSFKYRIVRKISCVYCDFTGSFFEVKNHHNTAHSGYPMATCSINDSLRCSECEFAATIGKDELIQHAASIHKNYSQMVNSSYNFVDQALLDILLKLGRPSMSYRYNFCSSIYQDQKLCLTHIKTLHPNQLGTIAYTCYTENKLYYCKQCNLLYDNEKAAVQDLRKHTHPFLCNFCSIAFHNYILLKQHYKDDHKSDETGYKYVDIPQFLPIYKSMLLIFPNGLVMSKGELQNTIYGKTEDFIKLIESVEREELTRCISLLNKV